MFFLCTTQGLSIGPWSPDLTSELLSFLGGFLTDLAYYLQEADDGSDRTGGGVEQAESGGVHTDRAERRDRAPDTLPGQSEHRLPGRHRS